eukprot:gene2325-3161_t
MTPAPAWAIVAFAVGGVWGGRNWATHYNRAGYWGQPDDGLPKLVPHPEHWVLLSFSPDQAVRGTPTTATVTDFAATVAYTSAGAGSSRPPPDPLTIVSMDLPGSFSPPVLIGPGCCTARADQILVSARAVGGAACEDICKKDNRCQAFDVAGCPTGPACNSTACSNLDQCAGGYIGCRTYSYRVDPSRELDQSCPDLLRWSGYQPSQEQKDSIRCYLGGGLLGPTLAAVSVDLPSSTSVAGLVAVPADNPLSPHESSVLVWMAEPKSGSSQLAGNHSAGATDMSAASLSRRAIKKQAFLIQGQSASPPQVLTHMVHLHAKTLVYHAKPRVPLPDGTHQFVVVLVVGESTSTPTPTSVLCSTTDSLLLVQAGHAPVPLLIMPQFVKVLHMWASWGADQPLCIGAVTSAAGKLGVHTAKIENCLMGSCTPVGGSPPSLQFSPAASGQTLSQPMPTPTPSSEESVTPLVVVPETFPSPLLTVCLDQVFAVTVSGSDPAYVYFAAMEPAKPPPEDIFHAAMDLGGRTVWVRRLSLQPREPASVTVHSHSSLGDSCIEGPWNGPVGQVSLEDVFAFEVLPSDMVPTASIALASSAPDSVLLASGPEVMFAHRACTIPCSNRLVCAGMPGQLGHCSSKPYYGYVESASGDLASAALSAMLPVSVSLCCIFFLVIKSNRGAYRNRAVSQQPGPTMSELLTPSPNVTGQSPDPNPLEGPPAATAQVPVLPDSPFSASGSVQYDCPYPDHLVGPISMELLQNPVMDPCGHTFEKKLIRHWVRIHGNCPISRKKLTVRQLVPN